MALQIYAFCEAFSIDDEDHNMHEGLQCLLGFVGSEQNNWAHLKCLNRLRALVGLARGVGKATSAFSVRSNIDCSVFYPHFVGGDVVMWFALLIPEACDKWSDNSLFLQLQLIVEHVVGYIGTTDALLIDAGVQHWFQCLRRLRKSARKAMREVDNFMNEPSIDAGRHAAAEQRWATAEARLQHALSVCPLEAFRQVLKSALGLALISVDHVLPGPTSVSAPGHVMPGVKLGIHDALPAFYGGIPTSFLSPVPAAPDVEELCAGLRAQIQQVCSEFPSEGPNRNDMSFLERFPPQINLFVDSRPVQHLNPPLLRFLDAFRRLAAVSRLQRAQGKGSTYANVARPFWASGATCESFCASSVRHSASAPDAAAIDDAPASFAQPLLNASLLRQAQVDSDRPANPWSHLLFAPLSTGGISSIRCARVSADLEPLAQQLPVMPHHQYLKKVTNMAEKAESCGVSDVPAPAAIRPVASPAGPLLLAPRVWSTIRHAWQRVLFLSASKHVQIVVTIPEVLLDADPSCSLGIAAGEEDLRRSDPHGIIQQLVAACERLVPAIVEAVGHSVQAAVALARAAPATPLPATLITLRSLVQTVLGSQSVLLVSPALLQSARLPSFDPSVVCTVIDSELSFIRAVLRHGTPMDGPLRWAENLVYRATQHHQRDSGLHLSNWGQTFNDDHQQPALVHTSITRMRDGVVLCCRWRTRYVVLAMPAKMGKPARLKEVTDVMRYLIAAAEPIILIL